MEKDRALGAKRGGLTRVVAPDPSVLPGFQRTKPAPGASGAQSQSRPRQRLGSSDTSRLPDATALLPGGRTTRPPRTILGV